MNQISQGMNQSQRLLNRNYLARNQNWQAGDPKFESRRKGRTEVDLAANMAEMSASR
jgi:hypothetical protein